MATPKRKPSAKSAKKSKTIEKNRMARWLESNFRTIAFGILGLALLFRVWLLIELPRMPFSRMEKNPDLDMAFFDTWADRIAHGDFLTDTILHPYHTWHKQAAEAMGVSNDQEGKERWNKIYGGKTYHQEPLYPQVLGIVKMPGGDGHFLMYILQMLSTLLSIWMVIWLGRHYFGEIAGLSAGLLFTLYSPGLLFDVMLLRTSFTTCYALSLLVVSEQLILGKNKPWFFGLLGGIGYLLQTSMMLLWIPLLVRWLYLQKGDVRRSWQVVLGFLGVLSLLIIRNSMVGAPLMSDSSVGPVTYVLSNFPAYHPQLGFAVFVEIGKVMEITHGKMLASMLYIIGKHHTLWQWVSLQFEKLFMVFQWYEVPNNVNSYVPRIFSMPLKLAFIPWSFICGVGSAAMIWTFLKKKTMSLLFGVWSQVAVMVLFYVLCRFRVPMVAMMAVYAGYVIQEVVLFQNKKRAILLGIGALILWAVVSRPVPKIPVKYVYGELATYFNTYYRPKMDAFVAKNDLASCIELELDFLRSAPDYIHDPGIASLPLNNDQKEMVRFFSKVYGDLGDFYRDTQQQQKAEENWAVMKRLEAVAQ